MKKSKTKVTQDIRILIISLVLSGILFVIGLFSRDLGVLANSVILSTFVVAAPQLLLRYQRFRVLKDMESKMPTFLRDLSESANSGMPFHKTIQMAARNEYGKLSKEVKKMSNQISWGMTLDKVLNLFANRVKKSKRLFTSVKLIRESYMSGGDVSATLDSVADDASILEDADKERKSILSQYVVLMYAISLIFIVIVVAINKLLVPLFNIGTTTAGSDNPIGLTNPCEVCTGFECSICSLFQGTAQYMFGMDPRNIGSYYAPLFFFMAMTQAVFSGLVAGQIAENSITAGIKHSLILTGLALGAFFFLVRLGFMGV
jgi:flagellar protein FlaJ